MPSHLHPRSRYTTSLFTTTLLISFLVVSMPHIFPCPVPHTQFSDGEVGKDGRPKRRQRKVDIEKDANTRVREAREDGMMAAEETNLLKRRAHECPVPKPGGLIGQVLGFREEERKSKVRIEVAERKGRDNQ
jgi:cytochrome c oxidase assembly factor 2